ncbi:hypothetical protein GCM10027199_82680 [Amycolatopsis magusensis]
MTLNDALDGGNPGNRGPRSVPRGSSTRDSVINAELQVLGAAVGADLVPIDLRAGTARQSRRSDDGLFSVSSSCG